MYVAERSIRRMFYAWRLLIGVGFFCILVGIGGLAITRYTIGFTRLHVVGAYQELVQDGVIDGEAVLARFSKELKTDPWYVPVGTFTNGMTDQLWHISIVCGLSQVFAGLFMVVCGLMIRSCFLDWRASFDEPNESKHDASKSSTR